MKVRKQREKRISNFHSHRIIRWWNNKSVTFLSYKGYISHDRTEISKRIKENYPILIQIKTKKDVENILKTNRINGMKVKTYPDQFFDSSKGVIKMPELLLCSLGEIQNDETLKKKQGIADVKWIEIQGNSTRINTNTYILKFNESILLKEIKIQCTKDKQGRAIHSSSP